jgi:hypothetical protein
MRRLLGRLVVVLVLCDLAVVGVRRYGAQTHVHIRLITPTTRTVIVPPRGQATVTGVVTGVAADADVVDPVPVPFTVEVPARGVGGATIDGALVDGRRQAISWYAGQPLPVTGGPGAALDPSPTHVRVDPAGVTVALDGAARSLAPGRYATSAPVAVGGAGLATARDGIAFVADGQTSVTTTGRAFLRLPPRPLRLDGPGRMSAVGHMQVATAAGTRAASSIVFGPGSFTVTLAPVPGGYRITATLQGPLQVT